MTDIEIVRAIHQHLWNDVKIDNFNDLIAEDAVILSQTGGEQGLKKLDQIIHYWRCAFPDIKQEWDSCHEISTGEFLTKWHAYGRHAGSTFLNIKPSGRHIEFIGESVYTVKNKQLVRYASQVDLEQIKRKLY